MKRQYLFGFGGFAAFVALGSCAWLQIRPSGGDVPASCETVSADLDVITYNAAIAPGIVDYATPRLPFVIDALKNADFDILCLQEVWPTSAKQAVVEGLGLSDRQVYYVDTRGQNETGEDTCTQKRIAGIIECMEEKCGDLHEEQVSICGLRECRGKALPLYLSDRRCLNCLIASAGRPMDKVVEGCVSKGGLSRLYGGENGNMLISRFPMRDTEALSLRASGANRTALFATVDIPGRGEVEVACTHLSSRSYASPTHPDFRDWEHEQQTQISEISHRLRERGQGRPELFVGDMNIGRRHGWLIWNHIRPSWDFTMKLGFRSAADESTSIFCSSCRDNSLRGKWSSYLIDHVMHRNPRGGPMLIPACTERLFDRETAIPGYDGVPMDMELSDHYAVRVRFRQFK